MTWTADDDATGRTEVRTPRAVQTGRMRRTLTGALLGALVLGGAAGAWSTTRDTQVAAVALVLSSPDPTAVDTAAGGATGGDPSARNATYLETELVYLTGSELAGQVAAQTGVAPQLEASRSGDSNVIQIQATASDEATAVRDAQTAADVYIQDRQQRLTQRITAQTQALDTQIAATDAALSGLDRPLATGFDPQARQREVLSGQYADQLAARDALQRAAADVTQVASQVEGAKPLPGGAVSAVVLAVLGGIALGALVGAALPWLLDALRGRLRDEKDVVDLGEPVLSPPLPWVTRSRHATDLTRAVQLQALALPAGPVSGGSVAFLAPTAGVGQTFTAVQHARHAARRGRVLLVLAGGTGSEALADLGIDDQHTGLADLLPAPGARLTADRLSAAVQPTKVADLFVLTPGRGHEDDTAVVERALAAGVVLVALASGWAVVVDTAPLDRSDAGMQAARQCAETVLVTAARVSGRDEVERTLQVLASSGVHLSGVLVNRRPRRRSRRAGSPPAAARPVTTPVPQPDEPADEAPATESTGVRRGSTAAHAAPTDESREHVRHA